MSSVLCELRESSSSVARQFLLYAYFLQNKLFFVAINILRSISFSLSFVRVMLLIQISYFIFTLEYTIS